VIDAAELRDLIKRYGESVDHKTYQAVYNFGIWYANEKDRSDVVLSDWTPRSTAKLLDSYSALR